MEHMLLKILNRILITPYNWSLIVMALLFWRLGLCLAYFNNNFDISSTIMGYISLLSITSIIIGSLTQKKNSKNLVCCGIITQILSIFSLISIKTAFLSGIGFADIVPPITMFFFFFLFKQIWLNMEDKQLLNK